MGILDIWADKEKVDEVKSKAESHWEFNERWLHMVFVDAFVHGHKHGVEAKRQRRLRPPKQENKKEVV